MVQVLGGDLDRDLVGADAGHAAADPADEAVLDLDEPGERLAVWPDHGAAELVHSRPWCLIRSEAQDPLRARCGEAFFWDVTNQTAADNVRSGVLVRSKMVPAVTDVRREHTRHIHSPAPVRQ